MTTLGYGKSIWTKVNKIPVSEALPLIDLTFLLEEHIQTLIELCDLKTWYQDTECSEILNLIKFYQKEELSVHPSKRGDSLRKTLLDRTTYQAPYETVHRNYYSILSSDEPEESPSSCVPRTYQEQTITTMKTSGMPTQALFPGDLNISEVAPSLCHCQGITAMEEDEDVNPHTNPLPSSPPRMTTIATSEVPAPINMRINLIKHKHATVTDLTTLQLFQSFAIAAKKTDPSLMILPIDSTKQNLSSLTSVKQVENLTNNQLRLYFSSWFRDQPHSLSGFHLNTKLDINTMQNKLPLAEWLATYQYSVALCRSQEEEMSIVGALCYGSLFLHRDSLLQSILDLPEWIKFNHSREKPIIIDLIVKPFKSPGKSLDMIFVRSEQSKKEETTQFFLKLYDGTPKRYPRGYMLFFIPVTSKLVAEYTDAQRAKYLFNHQAYLGDEDCFAIFGLSDLKATVTLKDGKEVTIRTLLKSLPASKGMSRSRLFQVVEFMPSQTCVIVTFQRSDRQLVEERQFDLEVELSDQLMAANASKLFEDETQGLRFGHAYHKNRGKVIRVHNPTQIHLAFVQHADCLLSSPPKKRTNAALAQSSTPSTTATVATGNLSYNSMVQAQPTHNRSVADPNGVTTTTTTQTSQTVMAVMETRFQTIEEEQKSLKHRLSHVEHRTTTTDKNIRVMMAHLKITPATINRKHIEEYEVDENDSAAGNANLFASSEQGTGGSGFLAV